MEANRRKEATGTKNNLPNIFIILMKKNKFGHSTRSNTIFSMFFKPSMNSSVKRRNFITIYQYIFITIVCQAGSVITNFYSIYSSNDDIHLSFHQ